MTEASVEPKLRNQGVLTDNSIDGSLLSVSSNITRNTTNKQNERCSGSTGKVIGT